MVGGRRRGGRRRAGGALDLQGVAPADLRGVAMAVEPNDVFLARLRKFCYWLDARPERRIAIVAHWGVFYSLLGARSSTKLVRIAPTSCRRADRLAGR